MDSAKIAIIGDGAIGSLVASGAQKTHIPFRFLLRGDRESVLQVTDTERQTIRLTPTHFDRLNDNDLLVIPVKHYQLADAIRQWHPILSNSTAVVLLQNGMGGEAILSEYLKSQPVYVATTSHGALKTSPPQVRHTGLGSTLLGRSQESTSAAYSSAKDRQVTELLCQCFPPVAWRSDIRFALWQKLSVNLVINPLTALYNVPNGALSEPRFSDSITRICDETSRVMNALGYSTTQEALEQNVRHVISATAHNFSSMHQDIAHKRKTEIDGITGYLIKQAKKSGVDVPINTALYQQVTALYEP